jgi:hypothetical protein
MTEPRWTFGLEPLPQSVELAPLMQKVQGLALCLDREESVVAGLIEYLRSTAAELAALVPPDHAPRLGPDCTPQQRPYLDHSRDIGAYNPFFPNYEIRVEGSKASGTVAFPLAFEGPPGIVHGGVLATFFDCVVQHHNCDVGVAGKTTSLLVDYRRPTPIEIPVAFELNREGDERRITSRARLLLDGDLLCTATVEAVAGRRGRLPEVGPRVDAP